MQTGTNLILNLKLSEQMFPSPGLFSINTDRLLLSKTEKKNVCTDTERSVPTEKKTYLNRLLNTKSGEK